MSATSKPLVHTSMTRAALEARETPGDAATADLFTEVARGLDKSLWFLDAHLQR